MSVETRLDPEFCRLVAAFPIAPIRDEWSYQAAIAVLDRLFDHGEQQTPAQRRYFHALARKARAYEQITHQV